MSCVILNSFLKKNYDMKKIAYLLQGVASRAINYSGLIAQMGQVKWDLKEIVSEQSSYVEFILEEFRNLKHVLT